MKYVDTSVIVAALDPLDPRQAPSRSALEREEDKVVSELVLAELASALARRELSQELAEKLGIEERIVIPAVILYLIRRFKLQYVRVGGHVKVPGLGELYSPMALAVDLSVSLRLKALDLLHLAYAKLLKDQGKPVSALITVDEEFEKAGKGIEDVLGIKAQVLKAGRAI